MGTRVRLATASDHVSIVIPEVTYSLCSDAIDAIALDPIDLKGIGEFRARKVIGLLDSPAISVNLGKRNLSLVLDRLSDKEIEAAKSSLERALGQLEDYSSK